LTTESEEEDGEDDAFGLEAEESRRVERLETAREVRSVGRGVEKRQWVRGGSEFRSIESRRV
jgi:hypothetical protein